MTQGRKTVLALDSPRWAELDTFFREGESVPRLLAEWIDAIGFDQESTIYRQLFQLYLHQGTITNVAFAVVPWLVSQLCRCDPHQQADYLSDIGLVEFRRLTGGVHFLRAGGESEPPWLMADYQEAIRQAQPMAEDVLDQQLPDELRTPLWETMPGLFGNAQLAHKRRYGEERP